ncbi:MAG: hypothetical protein IJ454_04215 [Clostridia bacterium]|nr:hypothetical protein [Clostridia bacterium]
MIFKLVLFSIGACLVLVLLKENFRSGAVIMSVAVCSVIFMSFADAFSSVKDEITAIGDIEGVDRDALLLILKTLLVAYLTSFGCDICADAGEKAIATALETAGKAIMLSMAIPMLAGIFGSVRDIIGG